MNIHTKIINTSSCKVTIKGFLVLVLLGFIVACNPTKKLLPDQYIIEKVEVHNSKLTNIPKENFEAFFRQKPNRKLFRQFQFYVWWYNLFDEERIREKRIKRNLKYDRLNTKKVIRFENKNKKRAKKGKLPREPKLKDKESPLFIESLRDIGEPAVIYDSALTHQTLFQLSKYLFSKGYFDNKVTDTVKLIEKKKSAIIKYYLIPNNSYTINSLGYNIKDPGLRELILNDTVNTILKLGMPFDKEKFQLEQERVTEHALNNGYFYFDNAYITYSADSNVTNHSVAMKMVVKNFSTPYNSNSDSLVETDHPKFKIANTYIITEALIGNPRDHYFKDTVISKKKGLIFLLNKPLAYKRRIIVYNTDVYSGQLYRKDSAQLTYKQLLGLGIFKNVTIQFLVNQSKSNELDCYIICNPLVKQSITSETEGTNTSGNLGIDASVLYQNRNFAKGGELIELKLQGSIAAQKPLTTEDAGVSGSNGSGSLNKFQQTFNTIQFGPELSFSVPRAFFPFSLLPFRKDQQPRTYIKTSLNYQTRPEFSRVISTLNYGFSFNSYNRQLRHDVIPFEVYLIRANLLDSYRKLLVDFNDAFLLNSFQDHITTLSKYGLTYTSKENSVTGQKTAFYAKLNLQSSGSILREVYKLSNQPKDSLGRYHLFGIPFAQFLKVDADFRIYVPLRKNSRIVYRIAGGIGKPLANLNQLPYEQSFFSGGPNSVRAWRARTLGPGGYNPPADNKTRFDKIGDILLEGNIEYRFHLLRAFYGAIFVDAGNIWRLQPDPSKPGGEFILSKFADQIAIGGGFGIRWDLTFFVLRLDMATPLKYPKFELGNSPTFDPWRNSVLNFGIGYPF
ncbi:translocation and assembly module lipoprotein TamL [Aurantibacillus circumpalustris]|uniref:translocation and assembly module lipoprotein TamL n=1 Tax=Aurantibacillus circumpalustris TaxID=3036359 RepID=UPI00295A8D4D|nr:BamA/TamA family outer membrane protein [Aurantibacillus circumpalustris]